MLLNKTPLFLTLINGKIAQDFTTDYQIDQIFGSSNLDYYEKNGTEYLRIYKEYVEVEDYTKSYSYEETFEINPQNNAIQRLKVEPATEDEIQAHFNMKWAEIRVDRNAKLRESDMESMIYLPDFWSQKTEEYRQSWLTYRQALRDITHSTSNPYDVVWPTKPI